MGFVKEFGLPEAGLNLSIGLSIVLSWSLKDGRKQALNYRDGCQDDLSPCVHTVFCIAFFL